MYRYDFAASSSGTEIVLGGGGGENNDYPETVDIYDIKAGACTALPLSEGRDLPKAAVTNNKLLFAGGNSGSSTSKTVDIYHIKIMKI